MMNVVILSVVVPRNVRQMDRVPNKLVPFIVDHKHSNFCGKHSSLQLNR
jgi:hypothetical protein